MQINFFMILWFWGHYNIYWFWFFFCRLGGNPICNKLKINSDPAIAYHQQLNCRYNIIASLGWDLIHNNSSSPLYCKETNIIHIYFKSPNLLNHGQCKVHLFYQKMKSLYIHWCNIYFYALIHIGRCTDSSKLIVWKDIV
jgi:hypothetical protein